MTLALQLLMMMELVRQNGCCSMMQQWVWPMGLSMTTTRDGNCWGLHTRDMCLEISLDVGKGK